MAHSLPDYNKDVSVYDVETQAGDVQRGLYKKPSFYGDNSLSQFHSLFKAGIGVAQKFSNARNNRKTVEKREKGDPYSLTIDEFELLGRRASSISLFTSIPYETCEDFLIILCFIDNIGDLRIIANATQISELDDERLIRNPKVILNLPNLEKINFLAQALDGIVNMFRHFAPTASIIENDSDDESNSSILDTLSSLISGFGGLGQIGERIENNMMGSFLSELITGERVPSNILSKNPNLQSPSYAGKAFFGESINALSNIDIDQLFAKPIAVFPKPSSGSGSTSFGMQNFGSFGKSMPLTNFVSKIMTGSPNINSPRKANIVNNIVEKVTTFTGAKSSDNVEIFRADNALPIQMALATGFSGLDKLVFPTKTFSEGWTNSQSVSAVAYNLNPGFMEAARRFL